MANKHGKRYSVHQTSGQCKLKPQSDTTSHQQKVIINKQANKPRRKITNVGEIWTNWNPLVLPKRMQNGTVTVGNSSVIFQKLKTEFPYDPAVLFLGIFPKDAEAETNRQRAHQCSQKRYSQQLTSGNRPSVQCMNGYTKYDLCIQWNVIQP